jgi:hypothetical protein
VAIVLILGLIGGCSYVAYKGISALHPTAASLRPDFPVYLGARQQTSFAVRPNSSVGTVTTVQWITKDKPSPVIAGYRAPLNQGDWQMTDQSTSGPISRFQILNQKTGATGELRVQDQLVQTAIPAVITTDAAVSPSP